MKRDRDEERQIKRKIDSRKDKQQESLIERKKNRQKELQRVKDKE